MNQNSLNNRSISISWLDAARFILVGVGFLALWYLRDLIALLISSVVIAAALETPILFLIRKGWSRFTAVITIYFVGLILLGALTYFTVPMLISQTKNLAATLLNFVQRFELPLFLPDIKAFLKGLSEDLTSILPTLGRGAGQVFTFLSGAVGMMFGAILVFVVSFYIALQEDWVEKSLRALVPKEHEEYFIDLWERTERKIGRWFSSQLILSTIVGAPVFFVLYLLDVEYAPLIAILTGVLDIIPIAGPILAGIIAFIVTVSQNLMLGIYTLILFVIMQQLEAYVFSPIIRQKALGLSPVMVVFALLVGGRIAGFWGIIISIPLAAAISEFYSDIEKRKVR
jgi:predicted PurR-regulated permease PerM